MANELILIVEDNPKNLKLVRDTLQVKGYQTIEAETGEEGVRLAHERHPALILMDIQLPGINGIEALQQLRADPVTRPTPVIAITASVMTRDQTRIMAAGFDGFQGKPISIKHIRARYSQGDAPYRRTGLRVSGSSSNSRLVPVIYDQRTSVHEADGSGQLTTFLLGLVVSRPPGRHVVLRSAEAQAPNESPARSQT